MIYDVFNKLLKSDEGNATIDVTPNKFVEEKSNCFLCGAEPSRKERVNVFAKRLEDISGSIEMD